MGEKKWFQLTLMCLVALTVYVHGCGVTQHNLIAHKAMNWFYPTIVGSEYSVFLQIIQDNQPAFQNGAAFPDWGYACGYSDESEAAHWPPFTLAAADYIQKTCGGTPSKWSRDCNKLVAFFFGVVSHQVADVAWHNLDAVNPSKQGFIQSMANLDFQGDFSSAHSVADTGAEFVVAKEFDLSFIDLNWYLPADDLATIYQKLQYNITSSDISKCNKLLYVEVHAVKLGGALLYPYSARKSAFLVDQLLDFWLGGVDDNAIWSQWCWEQYLMFWFSPDISGPTRDYELCKIQYSLFSDCERCFEENINYPFKHFIAEIVDQYGGITETKLENGAIVYGYDETFPITIAKIIDGMRSEFEVPDSIPLPSDASSNCIFDLPSNSVSFTISEDFAYLGSSIATGDLNNDSIDDLIIGVPGHSTPGFPERGGLFVLAGNTTHYPQNFTLAAAPSIIGNYTHDRFGESIVVIDLNLDGINDIVVSSPTTSAGTLQYIGQLYVFFGNANNPNYFFDLSVLTAQSANLTITSMYNYTNLGSVLVAGDCNNDGYNDLIIGSPFSTPSGNVDHVQVGKVFVIYSSNSIMSSSNIQYIENYANVTIVGESQSIWFGYQIELGTNGKTPLLIVSAPTYGQSPPSVGRIIAFDLALISSINGDDYGNSVVFAITGNNKWDQIGYSISFGSYLKSTTALALSSPGYKPPISIDSDEVGAVYVVDISSLSGEYTINDMRTMVKLEGDEKFARFGWSVKLVDTTGMGDWNLWISQPRKKTEKEHPESGAVYQWNALESASHTGSPSESANFCMLSTAAESRFGQVMAFLDFNGDRIKDAVITSPRYETTMSGGVAVIYS